MRELFGSIASTKLGMPIVIDDMRLICELVMGKGQRENERHQREGEAEDVLREVERGRALYVVYDAPALADDAGHDGKVVFSSSTMWLTWLAASLPEAMAMGAVGLFEREHVVDTVAGHGDGVAVTLERADKFALLVGRDTAEHCVFLYGLSQCPRRF